jgi:hypothetical protein
MITHLFPRHLMKNPNVETLAIRQTKVGAFTFLIYSIRVV